jgi:hypothetical protein
MHLKAIASGMEAKGEQEFVNLKSRQKAGWIFFYFCRSRQLRNENCC